MDDLADRILMAQVAACNCDTKTPELKYHDPKCRYRVLCEAFDRIVDWQPIKTAPKDREIDIWVTGRGSRRIADCRWGKPSRANWGDRYGADRDLPDQWITRGSFALDRRNGVATHWMERPAGPLDQTAIPESADTGGGDMRPATDRKGG